MLWTVATAGQLEPRLATAQADRAPDEAQAPALTGS
jgi:hypothetical protein